MTASKYSEHPNQMGFNRITSNDQAHTPTVYQTFTYPSVVCHPSQHSSAPRGHLGQRWQLDLQVKEVELDTFQVPSQQATIQDSRYLTALSTMFPVTALAVVDKTQSFIFSRQHITPLCKYIPVHKLNSSMHSCNNETIFLNDSYLYLIKNV